MAMMRERSPDTAADLVEAESWVETLKSDGSWRHAVLLHIGAEGSKDLVWALATAVEKAGRDTAYILLQALLNPAGEAISGPEGRSRARWALHDRERTDLQEQDRQDEAADPGPPVPVPATTAVPVPLSADGLLILPPDESAALRDVG
jgi:hypothetical protein